MSIVPIESPIEWMINRLWSFCAHNDCKEMYSNLSKNRTSNVKKENPGFLIPEFILFRDGIPWKWIGTNDDGVLIRKYLRIAMNNNLLIKEQLEIIRHEFIHFQNRFLIQQRLDDSHPMKCYLCRVFYKSGEHEKITLGEWIQNEKEISWWQSILALKSWIPDFKSRIGVYQRCNEVDIVDPVTWLQIDRTERLDALTESFTFWMSPHGSGFREPEGVEDEDAKEKGSDIYHIVVQFHVIASNEIWLSEILEGSMFVKQYLPILDKNDHMISVEDTLHSLRTLRQKLLTLTQNEMEALFLCWDQDHDGFVVAADLERHLPSLLGTPLSIQASARLIVIIGKSSPFRFSVLDLQHFVQTSPKLPRCAWVMSNVNDSHDTINFIQSGANYLSRSTSSDSSELMDVESVILLHQKQAQVYRCLHEEYPQLTNYSCLVPSSCELVQGCQSDCDSLVQVHSLMRQEMNNLSVEDIPHVNIGELELVSDAVGLLDFDIPKGKDSYERKVQAILEGAKMDKPCNLDEEPLVLLNLQHLSALNLNGDSCSVFITCDNTVNLLNYKACTVQSEESLSHRFIISNGLKQKLVSLYISIVYSGTFIMGKYCPGLLKPSLRFQPLDISGFSSEDSHDESISDSMLSVGDIRFAPPSDNGKVGQVIISLTHEPFIQSGVFELIIQADTLTRYSIHVSGKACIFVDDVLHHKLDHFFKLKDRLEEKIQGAQYCWLELRLEEQKFYSVMDLISNAEYELKRTALDLDQNENLYLSTDYDEQYHVLKHLNWDFSYFCRLVSLRQRQLLETLSRFWRSSQVRCALSKKTQYLNHQISRLLILLLRCIDCVHGSDNALNAERVMSTFSTPDCVKAVSGVTGSSSNSPIQTAHNKDLCWINQIYSSCKMDTDFVDVVNLKKSFHHNMCEIESDPSERTEGTSGSWGFWQPRPLPLLRSIKCRGEIYNEDDVDYRLRKLILEQDRAIESPDVSIMSHVLHDTNQLFPKEKLLIDIEHEIKRMIWNQTIDGVKDKVFLSPSQVDERKATSDCDSHQALDEERTQLIELYHAAYFDGTFDSPFKYGKRRKEQKLAAFMSENRSLSCMACGCSPCVWKSSIDEAHLDKRRADISHEIITLKRDKTTDAKDGTNYLKDLEAEARTIDLKIKLNCVDRELHDIYASKSTAFVTVRALHGYDSLMAYDGALHSLEAVRDRLVATLISHEIVDGILEWMLQGWYFRENIDEVTQDDTQCYKLHLFTALSDRRTKLMEITEDGRRKALICNARNESTQTMEVLMRLERNIRFFFLCLIFMYFRTIGVVQKQKVTWLNLEDPLISDERRVMIKEAEATKIRKEAFDCAFRKLQHGATSKQREVEAKARGKVREMARLKQSVNSKTFGSLTIQRVYRGHIGRKVYLRWSQEKASYDAWNALCHASAIEISRTWRGYDIRRNVIIIKRDIAEYILRLRKYDHACL